ncbi:hypothetical protein AMAG_19359 [Allomyces macrogynus ATCC 38327]|uniref:Transmembrane protein n=1 Tax=Allomyces macrogynus (strain ATCC 38327) TaxID=578462 RepID=A0A0L0SUX9_ALLM3|nr:hypothetical protein AMAG_19359 [Allomyces macrogynus ATCC 38327]|eukprot:KNE66190.1 hypothetical protein AMAG_19359 [Allomyces macrogynus ATCC 38327]
MRACRVLSRVVSCDVAVCFPMLLSLMVFLLFGLWFIGCSFLFCFCWFWRRDFRGVLCGCGRAQWIPPDLSSLTESSAGEVPLLLVFYFSLCRSGLRADRT